MTNGVLRWLVVAGALTATVVAGCGGGGDGSSGAETVTVTETTPIESTTEGMTTTTDTSEPTPDPKDLVAQLSDLPTGYSIDRDETGPLSLKEALEDRTPEEAVLIKAERVSGYDISFQSPNLRVIACRVVVYRSSDGADRIFDLGNDQFIEKAREQGGTAEQASIEEKLGDETVAFTFESKSASVFVVAWREDSILALCTSGGLIATDPSETVRVSQAQQERIAAALR